MATKWYTLYDKNGNKKQTVNKAVYDAWKRTGNYTTSKPSTTTTKTPSTRTTTKKTATATAPKQEVNVESLTELLGYKNAYGAAETDAQKLAASTAADQLRASLGLDQGAADAIGGTNVGAMSAAQLESLIASMAPPTQTIRNTSSSYTDPKNNITVNTAPEAASPQAVSAPVLADDSGLTYDFDQVKGIYDKSINDAYAARYDTQDLIDRNYYQDIGTQQSTLLDTLRQSNYAGAANRGISKAQQAADQLSAVIGLGQTAGEGASTLAQDRAMLANQQTADLAAVAPEALAFSNQTLQDVLKVANERYGYDMSGYAAELGANSNDFASLLGLMAQQYASDTALQGTMANAAAYAGSGGTGGTTSNANDWASIVPGWDNMTEAQQRDWVSQYFGVTLAGVIPATPADAGIDTTVTPGGYPSTINDGVTTPTNFNEFIEAGGISGSPGAQVGLSTSLQTATGIPAAAWLNLFSGNTPDINIDWPSVWNTFRNSTMYRPYSF